MKYIWITYAERSPNCFWLNFVSILLLIFTFIRYYSFIFFIFEKKRSFHLFTWKSIILPKKFRLMVLCQERINKINPVMEREGEGSNLECPQLIILLSLPGWKITRPSQSAELSWDPSVTRNLLFLANVSIVCCLLCLCKLCSLHRKHHVC